VYLFLLGVEPKVNMPLEILDPDSIWSAGKIIAVSHDGDCTNVKVRYEGWGSEWDEQMPYPNPRLARIFTYTKRVKCLAVALAKKDAPTATIDRNWSAYWPSTVSFRTPHPADGVPEGGEEPTSEAEIHLRLENNLFVEPYAPTLLPSFVQKTMVNGGWWVHSNTLRLWKELDTNDPVSSNKNGCVLRERLLASDKSSTMEYFFGKNFVKAYDTAMKDYYIQGTLPANALYEGSLVNNWYRVQDVGGDAIDGVLYSGAFDSEVNHVNKRRSSTSSRGAPPIPPLMAQPNETSSNLKDGVAPTNLPSPISINDTIYRNEGVRRLHRTNRWLGTMQIAGNDIMLGSFASQSEASEAAKVGLAWAKHEHDTEISSISSISSRTSKHNLPAPHHGHILDIRNVPAEAVVSAFEESRQQTRRQPPFRLCDWVGKQSVNAESMTMPDFAPRKKRKQAAPKKLKALCTIQK
jgi:hypothetical protein